MTFRTRTAFLALALLTSGCALQLNRTDLMGTWSMTDDSIKMINIHRRPTVELRADGTLTAKDLPYTPFTGTQRWQSFYSGDGKWVLPPAKRTRQFAELVLDFEKSRDGLILQVDKDSRGLYIFAWLGEEGGERLVFRR